MGACEQFFEQLKKLSGSGTIILGIGNVLKGDDALGPFVCEQLTGKVTAEVIDAGTVPENYIHRIIRKAPKTLLIIDALDFGGPAGEIRIFEPQQLNSSGFSTHTLSPCLFVDMIRQNIELDVYFIGIQPKQTKLAQSISADVTRAARRLAQTLIKIFPA